MIPGVTLDEIRVADAPQAWSAAGFSVDEDQRCRIGSARIRLVGRACGLGIVGWSLRGLPAGAAQTSFDGIPTTGSEAAACAPAAHLNGVVGIDHVVLLSPDLRRTVESFVAVGLDPRRERDGDMGGAPIRQIFFKFGDLVVEVVGSPDTATEGPSTLWGITYVVDDIDASAAFFGERTSPVKDAVQSGRRITTLRHRELDLSVRTALISPHVRSRGD